MITELFKLSILTLFLCIQVSCGTSDTKDHDVIQSVPEQLPDASIDELVEEFGQGWPDTLRIQFVDTLPDTRAGLCVATKSLQVVSLSKKSWGRYTNAQRKILVFHELGHCILKLNHDDRMNPDGLPHSIMTTYIPTDTTAARMHEHIDSYKEQLLSEDAIKWEY